MPSPRLLSRSVIWLSLDTISASALSLLSTIIYARALSPADYGLGTLALVIGQTIGLPAAIAFHEAIVQRAELSPTQRDTAACVSLVISMALAALCWVSAEALADWFGHREMAPLVRWMAPSVLFGGVITVFVAEMHRHMRFRAFALASISGRLLGTAAGILTALHGSGPWSFIVQQAVTAAVSAAAVLAMVERLPRPAWKLRDITALVTFSGASVTAAALGNNAFRIYLMFAGYFLNATALGYLGFASRIIEMTRHVLSSGAGAIVLPLLSRRQREDAEFRRGYQRATEFGGTLTVPVFIGLALSAEDVVSILFGEHWLLAVVPLQTLAIAMAFQCLFLFTGVATVAKGRPAWLILQHGGPLFFACIVLLLVQPADAVAGTLIWSMRVLMMIAIGFWMLWSAAAIGIAEQLQPSVVPVAASAFMSAAVLLVEYAIPPDTGSAVRLATIGIVGASAYIASLALLKRDLLHQLFVLLVAGLMRR
jgi:teichuronic acid exporter